MFYHLPLIILILVISGGQAQKLSEPKVTCSTINKCSCEFICKTYPTNADEQFGQSGRDLLELQCSDGITSNGYEALGNDLAICLNCIRSNQQGAKSSSQLIYWSNICDKAWSTSISSAVDDLGKTFDKIPNGQNTCTNNTISARDDLSALSLFDLAVTPHPAPAPHRATPHAPAADDDSPPAPTRATNSNPATHGTNAVEDAVTGGNAQTLSQNRGMSTGQINGDRGSSATSVSGLGQATQTTSHTATATKKIRKRKTKKCKNSSGRRIQEVLSISSSAFLGICLGFLLYLKL